MSSPRNSRCGPNRRRTERGSAVITVLVLAAVTAVISSTFLFRSVQEAKLATRSYYQSVVLNLAEAGVEEGLFAANTSTFTTTNGWSLVSGSTTSYQKTITGLTFEQGTGAIYIRVDAATGLNPIVIAAGKVTIPNQPSLAKQLRVGATKRQLWANGIVSKGTLTFSGNTVIDSYNSTLGAYNASTNRSDQATVASASTALDTVVVGSNTSIYGYVATTGDDPVVGSGGRIYGATTPSGTAVDTTRIRHDFTANLPDATAPTTTAISLSAISSGMTLPRAGDTAGTNGRYLYTVPSISLAGNNVLTVSGAVDIIVTGTISVAGNAYFNISGTNPSLNMYCPGDMSLAGNGVVNATATPSKVALWGTATSGSSQTVSITGNGEFIGTIYAPNANVRLAGNGATSGAVIAANATISGNGNFHYDVNLATQASDTTFRVNAWTELTGAANGGSAFARDNAAPFNTVF